MPHIFLHIPKTGGTTLGLVFRRRIGDRYFDDAREQRQGGKPFGRLSADEQASYDLVRGHFVYGFHERFKGDARVDYLSMVRHPVKRVVSLHKHISRIEDHHLHETVKNLGLTEFVQAGHDDSVDNGQVRAISGYDGPFGTVGEEHLEQALANIDARFPVVGVLEKFDVSLKLFAGALGWPSVPKYEVRNVAPSSQQLEPTLTETDAILEMNRFDLELFEQMKRRVEHQIKEWRAEQQASS